MTSTPVRPDAASSASGGHAHDAGSATRRTGSGLAFEPALEADVAAVTAGHPDLRLSGDEPISGPRPISVLLYSDDIDTRASVRMAIGRRVAADLPPVEWLECATPPAVIAAVDAGGFDLLILDGESSPAGGLGLCKQLKDEIFECPPVLVLTGRPQDAWLATWSRADAAVPHPLDPRALAGAVAGLVRARRG
jgi:CheY-like chemotaxis protein